MKLKAVLLAAGLVMLTLAVSASAGEKKPKPGPLTGTSGPTTGRFVICGKSPATVGMRTCSKITTAGGRAASFFIRPPCPARFPPAS